VRIRKFHPGKGDDVIVCQPVYSSELQADRQVLFVAQAWLAGKATNVAFVVNRWCLINLPHSTTGCNWDDIGRYDYQKQKRSRGLHLMQ
jgi:hypothetical protein